MGKMSLLRSYDEIGLAVYNDAAPTALVKIAQPFKARYSRAIGKSPKGTAGGRAQALSSLWDFGF
jgi:hypothetical protein